ncbi:MAG: nucleoside triphosphate pyrophosphohydrolase, partial [Dehalococcoidia bacterium]
EELDEFQQARSPEELEHELGDMLAALVNVGRKLNIDCEGALRQANQRFRQRFGYMERTARKEGRPLEELSLDEQEALWQQAKRQGDAPPTA